MNEEKKTLMKQLDYFTYITGQRETFLNAVEYDALMLAVVFDPFHTEKRKARIEEILNSYKEDDRAKFLELADGINRMLSRMVDHFGDHLGEIYMELSGDKKKSGQYFTPYNVSKMMAMITFGEKPNENKITTLCEPTCGSGGMVIAAADVWTEQGFNYSDKALVVANDVARNCVLMSYLQISYTGMPAIVKWQDSLTQETWDTFITPAFALQYRKFKRVYDSLSSSSEM